MRAATFSLFLGIYNMAYSQYSLQNIVTDLLKMDSTITQLAKKKIDYFAIMISNDSKRKFDLKDTLINGVLIRFLYNRQELIDFYHLKESTIKIFNIGSLSETDNNNMDTLQFEFTLGIFQWDKYLFEEKLPLLIKSNGSIYIDLLIKPKIQYYKIRKVTY